MSNVNGQRDSSAVDGTRETARSSLAPSSDATALSAGAQVVATPSMELPPPIFNLDTAAANGADDVQEEGGSAISRSTSLTRKRLQLSSNEAWPMQPLVTYTIPSASLAVSSRQSRRSQRWSSN